MNIIKCTKDHLPQLQHISQVTFKDTFLATNTEENMLSYIESAYNIEKLTRELEETFSTFYLAYQNEENIGYIKINEATAQTELHDLDALELERIYLQKNKRGLGVGKHLLDFAINDARQKQKEYLWLGVWEENQPAIKFYQKHGFYAFSEHDFWVGDDCQKDILMRLDFK